MAVRPEKKYHKKTTLQDLDIEVDVLRNLLRLAKDPNLYPNQKPCLNFHTWEAVSYTHLGWCNASDGEGGQATTTTKTTVIKEKKAFKGTEIHAIVIQKNPYSDGKDKVLDCGKFEIDSVSYQGPPQKLTIKATSIPYSTKLRQEKKSKTWENTNLKTISAVFTCSFLL